MTLIKPFIKWAGGKRWLAPQIAKLAPSEFGTYIEPFAGGAAVFFYLKPERAIIGDLNRELLNVYEAIRDKPLDILSILMDHQERHSRSHYYAVRSLETDCPISRAANFLYLNRTCWNGLYRVNKKGRFNVPIGTKSKIIDPDEDFLLISELLKSVDFSIGDFEQTIERARTGDFLFVDPPYTVKHNFNGFVKYNQNLFTWDDQVRLRDCCVRARDQGVKVLISNADHESIRDLYAAHGEIQSLERSSVIAGAKAARQKVTEILVMLG